MSKVIFEVQGMSCNHCVNSVKTAVTQLVGVNHVDVNLAHGKVEVEVDPAQTSKETIAQAIEDQGYTVVTK